MEVVGPGNGAAWEWADLGETRRTERVGSLEGRTALVTGAGRGFGKAIAQGLALEGADVILHYNTSSAGAAEAADAIRALGRRAYVVRANIGRWKEVREAVAKVVAEFGAPDVLVNNVGDVAPQQQSWREASEEAVDHVLAVDVKGTMAMTHEVGSIMLAHGGGAIVNIASDVVVTGSARAPQYAAAKYGIVGLTKSYAAAFAPRVRVNAMGPGFIRTETTEARKDWIGGRQEEVLRGTLLQYIPGPEDLVSVVVFLASDASRTMTGTFTLCNGGYSFIGA